jgi:D-hydroxyproline dehydrogenase subunit gamma
MFRLRPDGPQPTVAVTVDGRRVIVAAGASAAAAVLAAGFDSIRETLVDGRERAPYCMMGVCFDCLAEIDGAANRQSCMIEVRPGMHIIRQMQAPKIDPNAE